MSAKKIILDASLLLKALEPFIRSVAPPATGAVVMVGNILTGIAQAEPVAVELYKSLTSGTVPTEEQLQRYAAQYESAYQELRNDLKLS